MDKETKEEDVYATMLGHCVALSEVAISLRHGDITTRKAAEDIERVISELRDVDLCDGGETCRINLEETS